MYAFYSFDYAVTDIYAVVKSAINKFNNTIKLTKLNIIIIMDQTHLKLIYLYINYLIIIYIL